MANKFKTFLDHLGSLFKIGAKDALAVEAKLLPAEGAVAAVVAAENPAAGATLEGLIGVVTQVEQVATAVGASTGTGQQKLAAALPGIEDAILSDPLFKGKTIANQTLFNNAIVAVTGSLADILNSFEAPSS